MTSCLPETVLKRSNVSSESGVKSECFYNYCSEYSLDIHGFLLRKTLISRIMVNFKGKNYSFFLFSFLFHCFLYHFSLRLQRIVLRNFLDISFEKFSFSFLYHKIIKIRFQSKSYKKSTFSFCKFIF